MSDSGSPDERGKSAAPDAQESLKAARSAEKINEVLRSAQQRTYTQEDLDLIKEKDKPLYDKFLALDKGENGVDLGQNLTETVERLDAELVKYENKTEDNSGDKISEGKEEYPGKNDFEYFKKRLTDLKMSDSDWQKMLKDVAENGLSGRGVIEWYDKGNDSDSAKAILDNRWDTQEKFLAGVKDRLKNPKSVVIKSSGDPMTGAGASEKTEKEPLSKVFEIADFALLAIPTYLESTSPLKEDPNKNYDALKSFIDSKNLREEDWKFMLEDVSANGQGTETESGLFKGFRTIDNDDATYHDDMIKFYRKYPTLKSYLEAAEGHKVDDPTLHDFPTQRVVATIQNYFPNGGTTETYKKVSETADTEEPLDTIVDITRLNINDMGDPKEKERYKTKFVELIDGYLGGSGYHRRYGVGINEVSSVLAPEDPADSMDLPQIVEEFYEYTGDEDEIVKNESENEIRKFGDEVQGIYDQENPVAEPEKTDDDKKKTPHTDGPKKPGESDGGETYNPDAGGSGPEVPTEDSTDTSTVDEEEEFVADSEAKKEDEPEEKDDTVKETGSRDESEKAKETQESLRSHDESLNILNDLAKWGFKVKGNRNFKERIEQNLKRKYRREYGDHLQVHLKNIEVKNGVASISFLVHGEKDKDSGAHTNEFMLKGFAKDGADKTIGATTKIGETDIQDSEANRDAVKKMFQKSVFNELFEPLVLDQTDIGVEDKNSELSRLAEYVKETYLDSDFEKPIDKRRAAKYAGYRNKIQAEKALDANWTALMASDVLSDDEKTKLKTLRNK